MGFARAHHFGKVPGVRTETVASDRFPVEPSFAFIGNGTISTPRPHGIHIHFQMSIEIFGGFFVDAAAHHHTFHAGFYGNRLTPLEDGNENAGDNSKINCDGEV